MVETGYEVLCYVRTGSLLVFAVALTVAGNIVGSLSGFLMRFTLKQVED